MFYLPYCPQKTLTDRPLVPGCLVHLRPPGVVGVVDDEEDLAPKQHKRGVGGDEALHHAVQPLQGVKQSGVGAALSASTLTL